MSDDWWTDYRQNRRIEELEGEVQQAYSYAASRSRALQSRLSEVQGTLERRLGRLARSFDAFVELSDLRQELAVYTRETAVRHRTRRLLAGIASGGDDPPPLGLQDCPGYWLPPAAEALAAIVRGDASAGEKFAVEACGRDADRAALFLTLSLATAGRHADALPWLRWALPSLGTTVTAVQRRLWTACADGAFGEPGRAHIERLLAEVLDGLTDEAARAEREQWRQSLTSGAAQPPPLPGDLQREPALTDPPRAAAQLTRLRTRVEQALRPADTAPEVDLSGFSGLVTTLVDEGSPEERQLVARARELRQIIEKGDAERSPEWDAPAGETIALLRRDIAEQAAHGPRELAVRVGAGWVDAIAGELAEQACVRPPDEAEVRVNGQLAGRQQLRVGTGGAPSLAAAQADIDRAAAVGRTGEWIGIALAAAGVAAFVTVIAVGLGALAVPAAILAVAGATVWFKKRSARRQTEDYARRDKERLAKQVQVATDAIRQCHSRHKDIVATVKADLETVLTLLAKR